MNKDFKLHQIYSILKTNVIYLTFLYLLYFQELKTRVQPFNPRSLQAIQATNYNPDIRRKNPQI